jgi:type IV pilus assembly protein PilN
MAHINLLPWREEALKAQQKQYFSILIAVGLSSLAIILGVNFYYQAHIDGQNNKNKYLKNEIAVLDVQIAEIKTLNSKKAALQKRIKVVEQLQRSRNVGTQILDEIAKIIPNGIYITELEKQGNILQLKGKSESNNHLANMMRAVDLSDLFLDATLESITTDDSSSKLLSSFKMQVKIKGLISESKRRSKR